MDTIFYIIKKDVKNILNKRNILLFLMLIIGIIIFPLTKDIAMKIRLIMDTFPLFLVIICSKILVEEFEYNTYKYTFTGKLSRSFIVISKSLSAITIAMLFGIIFSTLALVAIFWDSGEIDLNLIMKLTLNMEMVFISFTLFVSSIAFLISIITKNFIATFLLLYLMFFDTFKTTLQLMANKTKIVSLEKILKETPFLNIMDGFQVFHYSVQTIISLTSIGIVLLLLDCIIIRKKDL
ncbi:ABC transporter permease [Bacillus thuringiensis serovar andalousiensis]|uniref:Uncharacterized protein n=4 Tax=Bacillus thuringiensis TaxID=1428 RepID=A0A9W4A1L3_BACTO|nr:MULTISPECIES: ABC transporter permease [Bacillus cereus group]MEB4843675.1 ABC transporter permease [Paenibacillus jamilae]MBJ8205392.1 ABC transporter permease [Bacillus cereus]MCR6856480.1 ABC transporter permease [Bacillus thuringiensis]MCU4847556.1 ABC transporter permease [Bacillus cereus]MDA2615360.1 ABC transporter permease [Bacillus cereus]